MKPQTLPMTRILFAMLALLLFTTCKKETQYVYVSEDMKEWFNFKLGTYWVMKNTTTNNLDSIVIFPSAGHTFRSFKTSNIQYESYFMGFEVYVIGGSEPKEKGSFQIRAEEGKNTSDFEFRTEANIFLIYPFMSIPFQTTFYEGRYKVNVALDIIPSYAISGLSFDNVYHFHYTYPGKKKSDDVYYKKGLGFIKIVFDNDLIKRTYEIERWHVVN